jgi:hypothetical protein
MGALPCELSAMYFPNESSGTSHSSVQVNRKVISSIDGNTSSIQLHQAGIVLQFAGCSIEDDRTRFHDHYPIGDL